MARKKEINFYWSLTLCFLNDDLGLEQITKLNRQKLLRIFEWFRLCCFRPSLAPSWDQYYFQTMRAIFKKQLVAKILENGALVE